MSDLAQKFHDTYERLAPSYGYETRADTKAFDPNSPNGKLMVAVCHEVAGKRIEELEANRFTLVRIEEAYREQWPHLEDEDLEPYEQGILDDLLTNLKPPEKE